MSLTIKCVHDGHVGGPKQYDDFPLGNIFYFYANIFYCFSPPTWPPCTHSIDTICMFHHCKMENAIKSLWVEFKLNNGWSRHECNYIYVLPHVRESS